tara:strand:+ start:266 stop:802 length:537 start_codon:yes stop_codon:yes gene_type:complete
MISLPVGNFCDYDCAVAYSKDRTAAKMARVKKLTKKEDNLRKKKFRLSDLKTRKAAAKTACHSYIKARDLGNLCICCNRPLGKNYDSGHFLESGNNPKIRFDEDNIHSQSVYCNRHKGGDSDDYRGNLVKKIGLERVERLESMKGGTVKRTPQDYQAIEDCYKAKIKQLNRQQRNQAV